MEFITHFVDTVTAFFTEMQAWVLDLISHIGK